MTNDLNDKINNFKYPIIIIDNPEDEWLSLEFRNEDTDKVEFIIRFNKSRESNLANLNFHETMYAVYRHNIDLKNYTYTNKNYYKKGE